jgi:shikimate dehydrogenase
MHNAAFAALGLDCIYTAFRVHGNRLGDAVCGMRALDFCGFNVTIPHKVAIMPLLDEIDPLALKIGAVNTVVNADGKLTGFNTDAAGFIQALLENNIDPDAKNVVVVGAGGAAHAIAFALAERDARLVILNREVELDRAEELAQWLTRYSNQRAKALALTDENLAEAIETADILINATSVGMSPDADNTPVPAALIKPGLVVFDVIYNPLETRLLREAAASGAQTIGGLDMLVWQGILAFEKWIGVRPQFDIMKKAAAEALTS